jgi:hypothetical protein
MSESALKEMQRRYFLSRSDVAPKVFVRLTDNWIELTVRFIARERGIREQKDAMTRDILRELASAGITVASQTMEVSGSLRTAAASTDSA